MKSYILFLFLLVADPAISQDSLFQHLPLEDNKVVYTRIIDIDSGAKQDIFLKAKQWAVESYGSQKAALQTEDKEAGYIAYKGYLPITLLFHGGIFNGKPYNVQLYHVLQFYIKDGRMKVVMSEIERLEEQIVTSIEPKKIRLENMDDGIDKMKGNRKEKFEDNLQRDARRINRHIVEFLNNMEVKLKDRKSAFDF